LRDFEPVAIRRRREGHQSLTEFLVWPEGKKKGNQAHLVQKKGGEEIRSVAARGSQSPKPFYCRGVGRGGCFRNLFWGGNSKQGLSRWALKKREKYRPLSILGRKERDLYHRSVKRQRRVCFLLGRRRKKGGMKVLVSCRGKGKRKGKIDRCA